MRFFGRARNGQAAKKIPTPSLGGISVLFPGPEGWELWSGPPGQPVCAGPAETPQKLRPNPGCVVSLPSRSFFSVPLWVPVVEDSPAREQTQMRLEMKGMLGGSPESAVWNFESIRREQMPGETDGEVIHRQLESTAVLALPFREDWLVEEAARYEPAGRMLPAPAAGSIGILRRELGRWVADFYQGGKWLHTQPLLRPRLDGAAAVELTTTTAQLESEGILSRLDGWWVRDVATSLEEGFHKGLPSPVQMENRPPPAALGEAWNLPPPALTELRAERLRGAQKKKLIQTALLAYLVLGFLVTAVFAWPLVRLLIAKRELSKIGAEAASIQSTAMLWREAGAWLEPRRNALELLWQVSRPLIESDPPKVEGVRLTLFDLNSKRLLLQGEGKDLERVEKYLQWLKNEPALAGFTWKNPQPRLLGNGNASFTAEGIPPGVDPESEKEESGENTNAP